MGGEWRVEEARLEEKNNAIIHKWNRLIIRRKCLEDEELQLKQEIEELNRMQQELYERKSNSGAGIIEEWRASTAYPGIYASSHGRIGWRKFYDSPLANENLPYYRILSVSWAGPGKNVPRCMVPRHLRNTPNRTYFNSLIPLAECWIKGYRSSMSVQRLYPLDGNRFDLTPTNWRIRR